MHGLIEALKALQDGVLLDHFGINVFIINIYSLWCLSVFILSSDHRCLTVYVWKAMTYFLRAELHAQIL